MFDLYLQAAPLLGLFAALIGAWKVCDASARPWVSVANVTRGVDADFAAALLGRGGPDACTRVLGVGPRRGGPTFAVWVAPGTSVGRVRRAIEREFRGANGRADHPDLRTLLLCLAHALRESGASGRITVGIRSPLELASVRATSAEVDVHVDVVALLDRSGRRLRIDAEVTADGRAADHAIRVASGEVGGHARGQAIGAALAQLPLVGRVGLDAHRRERRPWHSVERDPPAPRRLPRSGTWADPPRGRTQYPRVAMPRATQ